MSSWQASPAQSGALWVSGVAWAAGDPSPSNALTPTAEITEPNSKSHLASGVKESFIDTPERSHMAAESWIVVDETAEYAFELLKLW